MWILRDKDQIRKYFYEMNYHKRKITVSGRWTNIHITEVKLIMFRMHQNPKS